MGTNFQRNIYRLTTNHLLSRGQWWASTT